jgi:hypothetical protein
MGDRRKPPPKPGPNPGPGPMRGGKRKTPRRHSRPPKTWVGYTLDPGQRAALEKKFNKSWHQTFTSFSFFDSFRGPKK